MPLEIANWIDELVNTNPVGATDPKSEGDDHLRMLKVVLGNQFGSLGMVALINTAATINTWEARIAANEANIPIQQAGIDANTGAITALDGRVAALEAGAFPAGTVMLFRTAPPAGWVATADNDAALRVAPAPGSGGAVPFSTVFGQTATGAHTLTGAQSGSPIHGHNMNSYGGGHIGGTNGSVTSTEGGNTSIRGTGVLPLVIDSVAQNAAEGHSHTMNMNLSYINVIFATKS